MSASGTNKIEDTGPVWSSRCVLVRVKTRLRVVQCVAPIHVLVDVVLAALQVEVACRAIQLDRVFVLDDEGLRRSGRLLLVQLVLHVACGLP